jgi:quercetin dioxygenase-like cupin family protein
MTPPAQVIQSDDVVWHGHGGKAKVRTLVQGGKAWIGTLVLEAAAQVPLHRDATEEYIVVTQGGGVLWIDGKRHVVVVGSAVFMPAGAQVRFENGARPTTILQVFAGPGPAAKYDSWKPMKGE